MAIISSFICSSWQSLVYPRHVRVSPAELSTASLTKIRASSPPHHSSTAMHSTLSMRTIQPERETEILCLPLERTLTDGDIDPCLASFSISSSVYQPPPLSLSLSLSVYLFVFLLVVLPCPRNHATRYDKPMATNFACMLPLRFHSQCLQDVA